MTFGCATISARREEDLCVCYFAASLVSFDPFANEGAYCGNCVPWLFRNTDDVTVLYSGWVSSVELTEFQVSVRV